jgi:hypothetical protein
VRASGEAKNSKYACKVSSERFLHSAMHGTHLLVHVSVLGTPPERRVIALDTIDPGLRVDGQESLLVDPRERLADDGRLLRRSLVAPRQRLKVTSAEASEKLGKVGDGERVAPESRGAGWSVREGEREIELAEGRRRLVTPSTVGELHSGVSKIPGDE